mgnify:CR=1 FL=1
MQCEGDGGSKKKGKVTLSFWEDFFLSGVAAVTSKTISAPIERVKMVSAPPPFCYLLSFKKKKKKKKKRG